MEIFIANLDTRIQEELLAKLFEVFGPVSSAVIAKDKITGVRKGFGFVTMDSAINAQAAIDDLNGRELVGKILSVRESIPKDSKISWKKSAQPINDIFEDDHVISLTMNDDFEVKNSRKTENEADKVIDKTEFTKTNLEDGLIKISFKK